VSWERRRREVYIQYWDSGLGKAYWEREGGKFRRTGTGGGSEVYWDWLGTEVFLKRRVK
jgi:hypothetical protein